MIKTWIEKLKALYAVSDSIWILYRIEDGDIKTFGHYTDYDRAKRWADAGEYKILESKPNQIKSIKNTKFTNLNNIYS